MSKYDASELTNEGLRLSSLAANGKTSFTITRVASTADDLSGVDVTELTALPNEVQTGAINDRLNSPDGNGAIVGTDITFENSGLTESYSIGAVGLYATETGEGKSEVLYAVVKAIKPEFIPDFADKVLMQFGMIVYVIVGKTENVAVTINPAGMATKEYVDKAIEDHKVILPSTLMYSNEDANISARWKFEQTPTDVNGNQYATKNEVEKGYVKDNGDGSASLNGDNIVLADDTKVIHRSPDTGLVTEKVDFINATVNGGKSVATSDDLKSVESKAWHKLVFDESCNLNGALVSSYIVYQIHDDEKYISFFYLGIGQSQNQPFDTGTPILDLSSVVKEISKIDFRTGYGDIGNNQSNGIEFKIEGAKVLTYSTTGKLYIAPDHVVNLFPLNNTERRIYYTELI
ncbi:hypothetical protein ACUIJQ_08165 [Levilactobacillus hammesii]|uniref:Uncharacterized protein n=1 Tax=Levilactobacillus hammesii DSM 16381 TaxID=1423753 RepID=A0A0R1V0M6_9LACO|nr:hypothetical protein [Levilactobacillus hammesii]KRL95579.1 hypothetical protein FD28_GL002552 [Levilactobacillus hammesii DSM 16381]